VQPVFAALLHPREPQEIQRTAVEALAGFNSPEVAALLLERWSTYTPAVRADVVQALLGNRNRILPLLGAIESGRVAANQVPPARRAVLLHSKDAEVQSRAARLFSNEQAGRADVIKRYEPALRLTGDAARGEKVYQTNCMICHRHGAQGNNLGPDLASVRQWLPEQILVNVLDPNREVAPNFVTYAIEQKDGGSLVGLISDETPTSVTLKTPDNVAHVLLRPNLISVTNLGVSLMPEGLEAVIPPEAMADLLAFLRQP
jgi:putative heme-binding domain-containing protein